MYKGSSFYFDNATATTAQMKSSKTGARAYHKNFFQSFVFARRLHDTKYQQGREHKSSLRLLDDESEIRSLNMICMIFLCLAASCFTPARSNLPPALCDQPI